MFNRCDDPVFRRPRVGLGLNKAGRKLAASTSPTEPQTAQSHYGSREVRIETRRRTTCVATKAKNKNNTQRRNQHRSAIDISDRLIEPGLFRHHAGVTFFSL